MSVIARVLKGLGRSLQKIASFFALIGLILIIALAVAFPLWYFSSNFSREYTIFVLALIAAALLSALISRFVRLSRDPGALQMYVKRTIVPILKTVALVIASIGVIYGIAILVSRGQTAYNALCGPRCPPAA